MKRLKYIAIAALLASFSLQSCDLERYPLTDLSEEKFWNDEKNATLALTSLYRGSITNGLEYGVSDFWSYHGLLFMEHLSDNGFDRRGENNPFFNISSGKLLNDNSFIKSYSLSDSAVVYEPDIEFYKIHQSRCCSRNKE